VSQRQTRSYPHRRVALGATTTAGLASILGLSAGEAQAATPTDDSVVVTARKPTLTALSEQIQNTAQTINVLPQALLHEQGVTNLQQALKNVPGVTLNAGEGGAHGDTVNLRGFPANDDFFLDGLRDTGFYTRDSFNDDGIEIYKGPASTLFGRGSTGGVINQVSKTPTARTGVTATGVGGTNSEARGTIDANYAFAPGMAVRLNAMDQTSGVADRPYVKNDRFGVAPSIALGMGQTTTFIGTYLHQEERNIPDPGTPFVGHAPAAVPWGAYYGLPSDDRTTARVDIATAKLTHAFSDALSISETTRYGHYVFGSFITEPHYATAPAAGTPLSAIMVQRDRPAASGVLSTAMSAAQLTYKAQTGPLSHTLIVGLEIDREDLHQQRYANQLKFIATTPLLAPDPNEPFPGHQTTVSSQPNTSTQTTSALFGDTIDLGKHWTLAGAVRLDRFFARYDEAIGNTHLQHVDTIATPRVSLVYKPTSDLSVYAAYGTSYDPSAENLTLSAKTANLAPEMDHTYEVGVKALALNHRLALTGAVFDTQMQNARVTDPVSLAISLQGNLEVKGLELGATGHVTDHLELMAGYTYLDARTVSSLTPGQVGQLLPNTAHNQFNLWTVYDASRGLSFGGGINYIGQRAADQSGVAHIPGYVTVDGMVSYRINDHLGLQLNAFNLADAHYYANAYYSSAVENHVVPGAGRTVTLTATVRY
jgi:catecholate siderophore receptor